MHWPARLSTLVKPQEVPGIGPTVRKSMSSMHWYVFSYDQYVSMNNKKKNPKERAQRKSLFLFCSLHCWHCFSSSNCSNVCWYCSKMLLNGCHHCLISLYNNQVFCSNPFFFFLLHQFQSLPLCYGLQQFCFGQFTFQILSMTSMYTGLWGRLDNNFIRRESGKSTIKSFYSFISFFPKDWITERRHWANISAISALMLWARLDVSCSSWSPSSKQTNN